jgi:hypothetical protein
MVGYQAHVQNVGWQGPRYDDAIAGTVGESLRMEALKIRVVPSAPTLAASLAVYSVSWLDFSGPCFNVSPDEELCPQGNLQDNDDIYLEVEDGTTIGLRPWELEVTLKTRPPVNWWKEIKAFRNDGTAIEWVDTQDDGHGPVSFTVDVRTTGALVFSKSKFLNIRTGVYDLRGLLSMGGKQVTFTWLKDKP